MSSESGFVITLSNDNASGESFMSQGTFVEIIDLYIKVVIHFIGSFLINYFCEKIKNFSKDSESIKLISLEEASDFNLQSYKDIIIGASIRYGKYNKNLYK